MNTYFTMENALVSIIVPAYNLEGYIEGCIRSLQCQSYKNIEIIVVDDGSTDSTFNIVDKLSKTDKRIRLFHQENGGAAKARNNGMAQVRGEYVTFVDGDDFLDDDTISENMILFKENPYIDWVTFPMIRVDEDKKAIVLKNEYNGINPNELEILHCKDFVPAFYNHKLSGVCCGAIYRKASIESIKFPEGEFYEDSFWFIDLICSTKKGIISPKGRYLYVNRAGSSQKSELDAAHLASTYRYSEKKFRLLRQNHPEFESYYTSDETSTYYIFKIAKAKRTPGASKLFKGFKETIRCKPKLNWKVEIKCLIYTAIGYRNIRKILYLLNFYK